MQLLEDRIRAEGIVKEHDVLTVDMFLNHQMDVFLFQAMAKEWHRLFADGGVTKLLTIEASGIGLACVAGLEFGCPVVFAKKAKTSNISDDVYHTQVTSYTHGGSYPVVVSKEYLLASDRVLLIDDFLANGCALDGLLELCRQAGAVVLGAGIAVEKAYQPGGKRLREQGLRIASLARVASMSTTQGVTFC